MDALKEIAGSIVVAGTTIAGWLAGMLPPMAALASIAWIGFQFYHSAPMKERRKARKEKRNESDPS